MRSRLYTFAWRGTHTYTLTHTYTHTERERERKIIFSRHWLMHLFHFRIPSESRDLMTNPMMSVNPLLAA